MNSGTIGQRLSTVLQVADPRRSQGAAALWLIAGLAMTYAIGAAIWVGGIARDNVVEQHARRLALETDQLSSDLSQAIIARLVAIRAAEGLQVAAQGDREALDETYRQLSTAYPRIEWTLMADASARVVRAEAISMIGTDISGQDWYQAALKAPCLGQFPMTDDDVAQRSAVLHSQGTNSLGDLAAPLKNREGRIVGVIVARLSWQRSLNPMLRLTDEAGPQGATEEVLLDAQGSLIAGPVNRLHRPWDGVPIHAGRPLAMTVGWVADPTFDPHFERLSDGSVALVARALLNTGGEIPSSHIMVQVSEPKARVFQRADAVRKRILALSIGLGLVTAMLGAVGAHVLTKRLKRLALAVNAVQRNEVRSIEAPTGIDEVAQLGGAFAQVLKDLERERRDLQTLSLELERRVAVRTGEVERLAKESRYAAVARERLKMARDMHDTLAHSMMALLSEIRYLRRLQAHDPTALDAELARAEDVAHEGLNEVRAAINQLRVTTVRDTGLGPALAQALERLLDRSGLSGDFDADPEAARFGDERAETLMQMAQEVLRNIERHAAAKHVLVSLEMQDANLLTIDITDDGVGFDPSNVAVGHFGLVGLHEQAELIGASLSILSSVNWGTSVRISLAIAPVAFEPTRSLTTES